MANKHFIHEKQVASAAESGCPQMNLATNEPGELPSGSDEFLPEARWK